MVFPIGTDDSEHQTTPYVTYGLIVVNVLVFLLELNQGDAFIKEWAFVPKEFFANPTGHWPTIFTSMFMHGGWLHLVGNMAYLWSFGDNVEDNFGHLPFFVFYILAGILAMVSQAAFIPGSSVPNVGASGAIAGILGAYLLMFPTGTVKLLTRGGVIHLPAFIAVGGWIALQFISVAGEWSNTANTQGGVAYMAHIGGFAAGFILALLFRTRDEVRA